LPTARASENYEAKAPQNTRIVIADVHQNPLFVYLSEDPPGSGLSASKVRIKCLNNLVVLNSVALSPHKNRRVNSPYLSDIEGGGGPVSQCVGLSVIVSLSSPPAIN
jgi:hypothetical protein